MTNLPEGWDDEIAEPITNETFDAASQYLRSYEIYLSKCYGFLLQAPEMNPCKDGSIDLSWHTKKARLLINIRLEQGCYNAFYYGDLYNDKTPIKGNVPAAEFSEFLAVWMKFLV